MMPKTWIIGALVLLGFGAWYTGLDRAGAMQAAAGNDAKVPHAPSTVVRGALPHLDPALIEGWKTDAPIKVNAPSDEAAELDLERLADEDERDAMLAEDRLPEQVVWRAAWLAENEDEAWTRAITEEMQVDVETLANGHVSVRDVSCRETVCRFYLDLSHLGDLEAFMAVERDPDLHYEFQIMNPGVEDVEPDEGVNAPKHFVEVLVAREAGFEGA